MFITTVGLQNAGIIADSESNLITIGNLAEPMAYLTIIGLIITVVLMAYNVKGYLFIGMVVTAILAWIMGLFQMPESIVSMPHGLASTALQLDLAGVFSNGLYTIIFTFLLITLFDTTGTMLGVAEQAGLLKDGKFPRSRGALLADAVGTTTRRFARNKPNIGLYRIQHRGSCRRKNGTDSGNGKCAACADFVLHTDRKCNIKHSGDYFSGTDHCWILYD